MRGVSPPRFFLSTIPATQKDRWQALAVTGLAALIFAGCAPFARVQLAPVWAFIPIYDAALVVSDLITTLLIFAQFVILRTRSLLLIAAGYLFTATMAVSHMLSFPGLFSPAGLLAAGPQTTAWLFMAWHAGFPFAVTAYAFAKRREQRGAPSAGKPNLAVMATVAAVIALTSSATIVATLGHDWLPPVMQGNHYAPAMQATVTTVWALSFVALLALAFSRPHSVFDLWLVAVMVSWIADIGLAAVFNAGRFDFGFYAGRIFGLLAANFVLVVLLLETGSLYVRTSEQREERLQQLQDELIHVARLNELGQLVSALAHELNQPLTAAGNYLAATHYMLAAPPDSQVGQVIQKAADQIVRAEQIIDRLRRLAMRGEVERRPESLSAAVEEVVSLVSSQGSSQETSIEMDVDPAISVKVDRVQVQQVLLNLIRNAIQAMANSARRRIMISSKLSSSGLVEVAVADTGPGLGAEIRQSLFQPFTSSKSSGMGVGLSICRSIIEAHGGRIWTTDNHEGGTTFHFTLELAA